MLKEFKDFINRGNVIDLAVAVVIGVAFTAIVNSLVADIITPIMGILLGGINFTGLTLQLGEANIAYGHFIQAIINFLIISLVVFLIVRTINHIQKEPIPPEKEMPAAPPLPSPEEKLLAEIRDLLKARS
jgi:large conductance mechanosensitive channel